MIFALLGPGSYYDWGATLVALMWPLTSLGLGVAILLLFFETTRKTGERLLLVVFALFVATYAARHFMPPKSGHSKRSQCQNNLKQFDLALGAYCYPPVNEYPPRLEDLNGNDVVPELFFCPSGPGAPKKVELTLANVGEYTDYIYIAGHSPGTPAGHALIICPPVNHEGDGANVLGTDHSVRWSASEQRVDAMLAAAASNGYAIVVSPALTKRSGGKYKSIP